MTRTKLEIALDAARDACEKACDVALDVARRDLVIPYCERTGRKFVAGMGAWSFHGAQADDNIGSYDEGRGLPKALYRALTADYPLNRLNDAGSMMQDYTPTTYGKK